MSEIKTACVTFVMENESAFIISTQAYLGSRRRQWMVAPQFLGVILCCQEFCSSLSTHIGAPEIKILSLGNRAGNAQVEVAWSAAWNAILYFLHSWYHTIYRAKRFGHNSLLQVAHDKQEEVGVWVCACARVCAWTWKRDSSGYLRYYRLKFSFPRVVPFSVFFLKFSGHLLFCLSNIWSPFFW